jgi:hypothetical protein
MSIALQDLAEILVSRRILTREQLAHASEVAEQTGARLSDTLVRLGYATSAEVMRAWADSLGLAFIDLADVAIPLTVIELMPESVARELVVLPLGHVGRVLVVALSDPSETGTVEKLGFILNKPIRPVLATREQIIAEINRYYGQAETESVDSFLTEFTDTAIDFTEASGIDLQFDLNLSEDETAPVPATSPAAAQRRVPPSPLVERHATVRYYHRMNPERMFPLLVILSRQEIQEVARRGVRQGRSGDFQVAEESMVEIEPILPGCACYPPRELVRVGPGETTATFWVVPHVLGRVMQARVVVRQDGAALAEAPLEMRVVKQSATMLMGALSLILPFGLLLLKHFRLDFETQLQEGFGLYAQVAGFLLNRLTPEVLTVLLAAATAGLYLWLRPRKRDVFWDVAPVSLAQDGHAGGERGHPRAALPPTVGELMERARAAFDRGEAEQGERILLGILADHPCLQPALLCLADHYHAARAPDLALHFYERALELGGLRAVHYFRASLSAHASGDTKRALEILQQAESALTETGMKGAMWYNMGCFAACLGRRAEALRYLDKAVDNGCSDAKQFCDDPDLDSLRSQAQFKRLLRTLGA